VRRKLAGLVLLLGAIGLGSYLFGARAKVVPVEMHYLLGDPPAAQRLEAVFRREGEAEPVARFATEMVSPDVVHHTRLPSGRLQVEITLDGAAPFTRAIEAKRDAVIRLELAERR
jgi:hypothetical protein